MLESILNNLSENELLRCRRISRIFNDTIRASNQLQRRLFLSPANTPHIRINPLLFHATDTVRDLTFDLRSRYDPEMFHLDARIEHYIEHGRGNIPNLPNEMFITQPPVERIRLHFRYFEAWTDRPAGYDRCELSTCGGIKVKDLVTGARETLERDACFHDDEPDFRLHLELKNGQELV
ncbi:unnamed protein product [Zymoseptoria tritici ST99CH_1A5]|uniref:F-box domain-containing protein n=1 Tax=Zymoseptoria tritici ST99CH_1A5 TaxID=1276529 RepID=A0A1Y6M0X5_ZYMTR|nr:unnamed protein product [Zymoseptoria tritici ST99CH_3D1]SMY30283.1 unnamed protein product [Zymoseptoria tritici ST99CH_1A5]